MMEYKGYVAAVEFDDSIDVLHGRVVNSGPYPIATFEATDAKELRREFDAVGGRIPRMVCGGWG